MNDLLTNVAGRAGRYLSGLEQRRVSPAPDAILRRMIVLFTDFGPAGPYVGQMKAVLAAAAPSVPVVDLVSDAPAFDPKASAYLLAALAPEHGPVAGRAGLAVPAAGTVG